MPLETVPRTWTIATWLVAQATGHLDEVIAALVPVDADACALQSLSEDDAYRIAEALGAEARWELSYYPRTRLFPANAIGLAVVSSRDITDSTGVVTSDSSSTWSRHRRIAQFATVSRADHSGYTIGHGIGATPSLPTPRAPLVWFRPEQVGVDVGHAVDLPDGATIVASETTRPIEGAAELMVVTFEMPWVQGDFPVD